MASSTATRSSTYKETLDTTYYGGYIGFGGEYSFGFIPGVKNVGGLYDRLGLRTFINARAGLYTAQTDYDGRFAFDFVRLQFQDFQVERRSRLYRHHLARDAQADRRAHQPVAVDRLRIHLLGARTAICRSTSGTTQIGDDDAFATRTMLRLNIGLGSQQLYHEPLK